jgi:hypothetical protein
MNGELLVRFELHERTQYSHTNRHSSWPWHIAAVVVSNTQDAQQINDILLFATEQ